MHFPVTIFF